MFVWLVCLTNTSHSTLMSSVKYQSRKIPARLAYKLSISESGWRLRKFTCVFKRRQHFNLKWRGFFSQLVQAGVQSNTAAHCAHLHQAITRVKGCSSIYLEAKYCYQATQLAVNKPNACFVQSLSSWCIKITKADTQKLCKIKSLHTTSSWTLNQNSNVRYRASLVE